MKIVVSFLKTAHRHRHTYVHLCIGHSTKRKSQLIFSFVSISLEKLFKLMQTHTHEKKLTHIVRRDDGCSSAEKENVIVCPLFNLCMWNNKETHIFVASGQVDGKGDEREQMFLVNIESIASLVFVF